MHKSFNTGECLASKQQPTFSDTPIATPQATPQATPENFYYYDTVMSYIHVDVVQSFC